MREQTRLGAVPRRGRRWSRRPRASWVAVTLLAVPVIARLAHMEERYLALIAATALTPVLLLVAAVYVAASALARSKSLCAVSGAVLLLYVGVLIEAGRTSVQPAASGPTLTVVAANLHYEGSSRQTVDRLMGTSADVLLLNEASPTSFALFREQRVLDRYPHKVLRLDASARGVAVLSRHPLHDVQIDLPLGWPRVKATVLVDGRSPMHLVGVHVISPVADRRAWQDQLAALRSVAADTPRPAVVVGDLNATPYHHSFRQLERRAGVSQALARPGVWWPMTWPQTRWMPAALQIDHILTSPDIEVRKAWTVALPTSDHRAVAAVLRLPG